MARRHGGRLAPSPGAAGRDHSADPGTGSDDKQRRGERTRTLAQVHAFPFASCREISCSKEYRLSEKKNRW